MSLLLLFWYNFYYYSVLITLVHPLLSYLCSVFIPEHGPYWAELPGNFLLLAWVEQLELHILKIVITVFWPFGYLQGPTLLFYLRSSLPPQNREGEKLYKLKSLVPK